MRETISSTSFFISVSLKKKKGKTNANIPKNINLGLLIKYKLERYESIKINFG